MGVARSNLLFRACPGHCLEKRLKQGERPAGDHFESLGDKERGGSDLGCGAGVGSQEHFGERGERQATDRVSEG